MKQLKISYLFLFITLSFTQLVIAEDASIYARGLAKMRAIGVINTHEQKKQLVQLNAQERSHENFQHQTRGVASKINSIKIYEIKNDPIEIPSN